MIRPLILIALAAFLAACGGSGSQKAKLPGLPPETAQQFRGDPEAANLLKLVRVNPTAAFGAASDLARTGNCASASPALRCLARDGQGAAPAQFLLGRCLLEDGQVNDGLLWVTRAADGGLLEAQQRLFDVYRKGDGVPANGVEAQKWLTLSETNQLALSLGRSVETDYITKRDFDRSLTEQQRLAGLDAARNWRRQYWVPQADQAAPGYCGEAG